MRLRCLYDLHESKLISLTKDMRRELARIAKRGVNWAKKYVYWEERQKNNYARQLKYNEYSDPLVHCYGQGLKIETSMGAPVHFKISKDEGSVFAGGKRWRIDSYLLTPRPGLPVAASQRVEMIFLIPERENLLITPDERDVMYKEAYEYLCHEFTHLLDPKPETVDQSNLGLSCDEVEALRALPKRELLSQLGNLYFDDPKEFDAVCRDLCERILSRMSRDEAVSLIKKSKEEFLDAVKKMIPRGRRDQDSGIATQRGAFIDRFLRDEKKWRMFVQRLLNRYEEESEDWQ